MLQSSHALHNTTHHLSPLGPHSLEDLGRAHERPYFELALQTLMKGLWVDHIPLARRDAFCDQH